MNSEHARALAKAMLEYPYYSGTPRYVRQIGNALASTMLVAMDEREQIRSALAGWMEKQTVNQPELIRIIAMLEEHDAS